MSHAILYAKWAAYTTGTLTAWWLLSKLAAVLEYIADECRRRLATWRFRIASRTKWNPKRKRCHDRNPYI